MVGDNRLVLQTVRSITPVCYGFLIPFKKKKSAGKMNPFESENRNAAPCQSVSRLHNDYFPVTAVYYSVLFYLKNVLVVLVMISQ